MTFSDNTLQAEGLGDFFKSLGKKRLNIKKKTVKKFKNVPDEIWKSEQPLALQLRSEIQKRLYHHCQR